MIRATTVPGRADRDVDDGRDVSDREIGSASEWRGQEARRCETTRAEACRCGRLRILTIEHVAWFSLQKHEEGAHRAIHRRRDNRLEPCGDLLDTAALISNLDLVITVDTVVAHVAGALKSPCGC